MGKQSQEIGLLLGDNGWNPHDQVQQPPCELPKGYQTYACCYLYHPPRGSDHVGFERQPIWCDPRTPQVVALNVWKAKQAQTEATLSTDIKTRRSRKVADDWHLDIRGYRAKVRARTTWIENTNDRDTPPQQRGGTKRRKLHRSDEGAEDTDADMHILPTSLPKLIECAQASIDGTKRSTVKDPLNETNPKPNECARISPEARLRPCSVRGRSHSLGIRSTTYERKECAQMKSKNEHLNAVATKRKEPERDVDIASYDKGKSQSRSK